MKEKEKVVSMKTYSTKPGKERFQNIRCNYCNSNDSAPLMVTEDCGFVRCKRCGLVYQNPQPAGEDVLGRYGDHYFDYERENEENFFHLMILGLNDVSFFSLAEKLCMDRTFLDIGCATGMLLHYMKERGWREKGVEVCEKAARYGIEKRGVDIFIGTLENAGFEDESFSAIHCSHLIEHLIDPRSFFSEIHRILKPGGLFAVATPNIDGFQAKLFKERWRSAIADHMVLFSKKTLKRYLTDYRFTVLRKKTWGGLAKGSVHPLLKKTADRLVKFFGWGDVMIYLVRKEAE